MKNAKLTKIASARGAVLHAIKMTKDTPAEENFQKALKWLNDATKRVNEGLDGAYALCNAMVHVVEGRKGMIAAGLIEPKEA